MKDIYVLAYLLGEPSGDIQAKRTERTNKVHLDQCHGARHALLISEKVDLSFTIMALKGREEREI